MARASDRDPEVDKPTEAPAPQQAKRMSILEGGKPGEYVRVRHPQTGDHYTTTRVLAHKAGASLLADHQAVDQHGYPLPRKRNTKES